MEPSSSPALLSYARPDAQGNRALGAEGGLLHVTIRPEWTTGDVVGLGVKTLILGGYAVGWVMSFAVGAGGGGGGGGAGGVGAVGRWGFGVGLCLVVVWSVVAQLRRLRRERRDRFTAVELTAETLRISASDGTAQSEVSFPRERVARVYPNFESGSPRPARMRWDLHVRETGGRVTAVAAFLPEREAWRVCKEIQTALAVGVRGKAEAGPPTTEEEAAKARAAAAILALDRDVRASRGGGA